MPRARTTATRTRTPTVLKAEVGKFDGEMKIVHFNRGDNVQTLFSKIDFTIHEGESITDGNGADIEPTAQAKSGTVYYLTGNFKQGN